MKIDMEKAKEEFIKYTGKFNLQDENIDRKQQHSLRVMKISNQLAKELELNEEQIQLATLIGLLHDIGRKFGTRHLGHVSDGYTYMKSLGYDEAAKICLTHSFNNHTVDEYIGKFDVSQEELTLIKTKLVETVYDEYDLLIQLCDSLAGADGVLDIEERMNDVKRRYGSYPQDKWDSNIELMHYFEKRMNQNIYLVCEKDTFVPEELA